MQRIITALVLIVAVLLLSGTPLYIYAYSGGAVPTSYVRFIITTPYFAALLILGFSGLYLARKHPEKPTFVFGGFGLLGAAYFCIEILFKFCGGE